MSDVEIVNQIKNHRTDLIKQLESLIKQRSHRSTHITKDLNKQIFDLEKEIHKLTLEHRNLIKKCYSGSKITSV